MDLDLDVGGILRITPDVIATECTVILGMRGSGKSNSVARLLEQALANGVTASIIDPHNEYAGLRERFPVYIAGSDADIPIQPQHGALLAQWTYDNNASVILAIKDFSTDDRQRFLLAYCQTLKRLHMKNRRAHMIVVEEAHNFIPQQGGGPLKNELGIIAVEGRKFGLGLLISDQRSANIDKTVIGQAGIMLLHRATGVTDLSTYQDIADLPDTKKLARRLRIGEAIAILHYDIDFEPQTVQIKQHETSHGGNTPLLAETPGAVSQQSITALADILSKHGEDEESAQAKLVKALNRQIAERDEKIVVLTTENVRLTERVDLLSTLRVEVNGTQQSVPANMAVDRLEANTLIAPGLSASQPTKAPTVTPSLHASIERNAQHLQSNAQKLQRRGFDEMLSTIRSAERFQVFALKALIANENRTVNAKELSAITGYKAETITSGGMGKLKALGLIITVPKQGYRSAVRQVLTERYPTLDISAMLHELLDIRR